MWLTQWELPTKIDPDADTPKADKRTARYSLDEKRRAVLAEVDNASFK